MRKISILRWGILAASLGLILAGLRDHGYAEVFSKAVMICMECIGIG